jgi:hypothetical protein
MKIGSVFITHVTHLVFFFASIKFSWLAVSLKHDS